MNRLIALALTIAAVAAVAVATPVDTPEINPASGSAALTLLGGLALVIRARARR